MNDDKGTVFGNVLGTLVMLSMFLLPVFVVLAVNAHTHWAWLAVLLCISILAGSGLRNSLMESTADHAAGPSAGTAPLTGAATDTPNLQSRRIATEAGVFDVLQTVSVDPDGHQATVMAVDRMGTVGVLVIGFDGVGAVVRAAIHNQPWMRAWLV